MLLKSIWSERRTWKQVGAMANCFLSILCAHSGLAQNQVGDDRCSNSEHGDRVASRVDFFRVNTRNDILSLLGRVDAPEQSGVDNAVPSFVIPVDRAKLRCFEPKIKVGPWRPSQQPLNVGTNPEALSIQVTCDYYKDASDNEPTCRSDLRQEPAKICVGFEISLRPVIDPDDLSRAVVKANLGQLVVSPDADSRPQLLAEDLRNSFNVRFGEVAEMVIGKLSIGRKYRPIQPHIESLDLFAVETLKGKDGNDEIDKSYGLVMQSGGEGAFSVKRELRNPNRILHGSDQSGFRLEFEANLDERHLRDLISQMYRRAGELEVPDANHSNSLRCADPDDHSLECELRAEIGKFVKQANDRGQGVTKAPIQRVDLDLPADLYSNLKLNSLGAGKGVGIEVAFPIRVGFLPWSSGAFSRVHIGGQILLNASVVFEDGAIRILSPTVTSTIGLENCNAWVPESLCRPLKRKLSAQLDKMTEQLNHFELGGRKSLEYQLNRPLKNIDDSAFPPKFFEGRRGLVKKLKMKGIDSSMFKMDYVEPSCKVESKAGLSNGWIRIFAEVQ